MNILRHALWALIIASGVQPLVQVPSAEADICFGNKIGQERCRAASDILRKILSKDEEETKRQDEPEPVQNNSKDEKQAEDRALKPELKAGDVIYIPFPTPRPAYQGALPSKAGSLRSKSVKLALDVDPVTTAGIFSKCLDAMKIKEPDIRSQRRILKKQNFCITRKTVSEKGLDWKIFTIKNNEKKSGPLFVVLHDNEDSAFAAGVYGLRRYGGTLVAVEAGEKRRFKGQDPNRNFGTSRSVARGCRFQRSPAPRFTRAILKARKRGQPIIALHSNANGWSGNGGKGNISIKRKGAGLPFVSAVARSRRLNDEDTLIILAGTQPLKQNRKAVQQIRYFTQKAGVNVLYEHVKRTTNDCSLSNYVSLKRLGDYFNIEVETGDTRTQKKIVDIVMSSLR